MIAHNAPCTSAKTFCLYCTIDFVSFKPELEDQSTLAINCCNINITKQPKLQHTHFTYCIVSLEKMAFILKKIFRVAMAVKFFAVNVCVHLRFQLIMRM